MTNQEILNFLNTKFISRYSKELEKLNKNVFLTNYVGGGFTVPTTVLGEGGITTVVGDTDAINLNSPARVGTQDIKFKAFTIFYRIAVPRPDVEIMLTNPDYFNTVFDPVMQQAVKNYITKAGSPETARFGTHFISANLPGSLNEVFNITDDYAEFRLHGSWASSEKV